MSIGLSERTIVAALGIAGLSIAGCEASKSAGMMPEAMPLYDRLGGAPAITAVVDDFVRRAACDPAVNFTRNGEWKVTDENVAPLEKMLVQFISKATNGPQKYEGRDMKIAHAGMKITETEFAAIAADLKATLVKYKVPEKEQAELMAIVGTTHDSIVGQ